MISYVTVGADDLRQAERFYSSFLPGLGYTMTDDGPEGLSYSVPGSSDPRDEPPDFYVKPPFDGGPASAGNGSMVAFRASTRRQVRELHAAALAAGGKDEGAPGFRAAYSADFYVGYLRDPRGNKIALFCNDPGEPERPGRSP